MGIDPKQFAQHIEVGTSKPPPRAEIIHYNLCNLEQQVTGLETIISNLNSIIAEHPSVCAKESSLCLIPVMDMLPSRCDSMYERLERMKTFIKEQLL